jgi:hypothetical protein
MSELMDFMFGRLTGRMFLFAASDSFNDKCGENGVTLLATCTYKSET